MALENIAEALQDPEILAIAPVMPTKLNGPAFQPALGRDPKLKSRPHKKTSSQQKNDENQNLILEKNDRPKALNSFGFTGTSGRSGINRSGINGLYNALYRQGSSTWGVTTIKADKSRYTGEGVSIALLDTGIDQTHEAFKDILLEEIDFTGTGTEDHNGHGTHCAGTIFGKDVNGNRIGIAPGIDRALIGKVIGPKGGDSHMLYHGIEWALNNGAKIIALSLELDFQGFVSKLRKQGYQDNAATTIALDAYRQNLILFDVLMDLIASHREINGGAIIIAAAGNEDLSEGQFLLGNHDLPRAYIAPTLPGIAKDVISVGALQLSTSQNSSKTLSLADFSTSLPDIVAPGSSIISAKLGGGLTKMSGTSMACPHVAGVAALYWEEISKMGLRPGLRCEAVKDKLASTATLQPFADNAQDHSSPTLAPEHLRYGVGLVQAPT
ncbi:S8 family serine peptidase [Kiloniella sp.]|uniref:S8 family serine peptidase n=1 Tax=Kiloniella sp. TaxID=1938587 RepID=UPI003B028661